MPNGDPTSPDTPADARPQPARGGFLESLAAAPATTLFFALAIAIFAAAEWDGDTRTTATLLRFGASERGRVWAGEYWRFVTPMFLHIGPIHLIWNLYGGFSWARVVEPALGTRRYAALYLLSGIGGTAASLLGHDAVSAGASGALFGVTGAFLVLAAHANGGWSEFVGTPLFRTNAINIGAWFVIGAYAGFDNWAHAGGFVVGALATHRLLTGDRTKPVARLAPVVALVGLLVVGAALPRPGGSLTVWVRTVEEHVDAGRWAEARTLLATPPAQVDHPWHTYMRALVAEGLGDHVFARDLVEPLTQDPAWAPAAALVAARARAALDAPDTEAAFERALRVAEHPGDVLITRALFHLGRDERAAAFDDYAAYVALEKKHAATVRADVHLKMAELAFHLRRPEDAVAAVLPILNDPAEGGTAWLHLAFARGLLGAYPEAAAALDEAAKHAAPPSELHQGRAALALRQERWTDALAAADAALALDPANGRAHTLRADALIGLGRHAEAAAEYDRATSDDPAAVLTLAGWSYWRAGDLASARVRFDRAAATPGFASAHAAARCDFARSAGDPAYVAEACAAVSDPP